MRRKRVLDWDALVKYVGADVLTAKVAELDSLEGDLVPRKSTASSLSRSDMRPDGFRRNLESVTRTSDVA